MSNEIEKKPRDERAPVLGEDKAEPKGKTGPAKTPDDTEEAIDLPLEENQFNSQPG